MFQCLAFEVRFVATKVHSIRQSVILRIYLYLDVNITISSSADQVWGILFEDHYQ